jgi:hypothetical protein
MSQINRPALGLQQLLGSQNFGDNPNDLSQIVAPTLDMLPFFGSGILRLRRVSGQLAGEGEISSIQFDQPIALLSATAWCQAGLTGAGRVQLGVAISGPPSNTLPVNQQHMLATGVFDSGSAATQQPAACYSFPGPLVVEPGTSIHSHWLYNSANDPAFVQLTVLFYDLSLG